MSPEMRNILDTFTGADGGVRFVKLKCFVEALEQQASNGDAASKELLQIVNRFSKLIDVANDPKIRSKAP